jgi:hypothetical protein
VAGYLDQGDAPARRRLVERAARRVVRALDEELQLLVLGRAGDGEEGAPRPLDLQQRHLTGRERQLVTVGRALGQRVEGADVARLLVDAFDDEGAAPLLSHKTHRPALSAGFVRRRRV